MGDGHVSEAWARRCEQPAPSCAEVVPLRRGSPCAEDLNVVRSPDLKLGTVPDLRSVACSRAPAPASPDVAILNWTVG